jgi:hypothetical protein
MADGRCPVTDPLEHRQEEILRGDAARLAEERPGDEGVPFADLVVEHMRDPEYRREFIASAERRGTVTWLRSPEALVALRKHHLTDEAGRCGCGQRYTSHARHLLEELAKAAGS